MPFRHRLNSDVNRVIRSFRPTSRVVTRRNPYYRIGHAGINNTVRRTVIRRLPFSATRMMSLNTRRRNSVSLGVRRSGLARGRRRAIGPLRRRR